MTLVPITGTIAEIPILVVVQPDANNGLDRPGTIRVPDIMTFDKTRLRKRIGRLGEDTMASLEDKLRIHLGL